MKNLFLLLLLTYQVFSQDSTKTTELSELTVSASFQATEIRKLGRNLTVITSKQIENAPVKTLDGILQYAMNVDVRSRGPLGVQADISIRGGHYDQTLILLDGVKLNDPQTGHHSLNLPISLELIERIEVLQGGGSRVYGPSAFSGVINIITKQNQNNQLTISYLRGEHNLQKINGGGYLNLKGVQTMVGAENMTSDGFATNTAFRRNNVFLKTQFKYAKNGTFSAEIGQFSNKFGASNFYSARFFNQYEEVSSRLRAIHINQDFGQNFSSILTASLRVHNDLFDFDNYRTNKPTSINFHETNVKNINWINKLMTKLGVTTLGLEYRNEGVISNRLGEKLEKPILIPGSLNLYYQELFYDRSKNRINTSAYLEQWKQLNKFTISIGTLLNVNSQFGNEFFPGIDLSYKLNQHWNAYGSANKSLRFPTFTEMYLVGSTVIGDPNLQPEEAITYEMGVKRNTNSSQLVSSVFYKNTLQAIDRILRDGKNIPTMETIGDLKTYGFDAAYSLKISNLTQNSNSFIQSFQVNYAYINTDQKEEGFQSFYTLNYLSHKASTGINLLLFKNLYVDTWFTFKNRVGTYALVSSNPSVVVPYEPVYLFDTRLSYNFKKMRIFADATNIFNHQYYEFGLVEQPGRWLSAGISGRIGK